jgi:hypothetical protein
VIGADRLRRRFVEGPTMGVCRTMVRFGASTMALVSGAFGSAIYAADSVSGQFVLDGKALAPAHVAAFRIRDMQDARKFRTYVMLTATPVNAAAVAADVDPYTTAINDPAVFDADHLALFVKDNGEVSLNAHVGGKQYIDSSGTIMGSKGSLIAQCASTTAERAACAVRSAKPVETGDGAKWTLDVRFDAVVQVRKPGTPIARHGGDPGKAYLALSKAVEGNDLDAILAHLTESEAENYRADYRTPQENLEEAKQMLGFRLPKQPVITGGELIDDDTALLEVEGTPYEDSRALYLVEMRREDGRWRLVFARNAGELP